MSKFKDDEFYLYFIVRSIVMGLLGAIIFSVIISLLNTSKLLYILSVSVANFFIVLFITRVFDRQTRGLVKMVLEKLDKWPKAKNFLLNNF
jgi:TM2 domain-containing membrane protein YozV